jgi:hypothetical protein
MTTPEIVYLIIYIVFMAICGTYVFRVNAREKANNLGRTPTSQEASIAAATEREHPHGTGPNEAAH